MTKRFSIRRLVCAVLSAVLLFGMVGAVPSVRADSTAVFDFGAMPESSRSGSWGVEKSVEDGALNIRFTAQYAEQRYDLPAEVAASGVKEVRVGITSGAADGFCVKLLKGGDQAAVVYGTGIISAEGVDFDGIGLMSLKEGTMEYTLSGVEFVLGEQPAVSGSALKDLYADEFRMGVACEAISHWNNRLSEIGNPKKEALMLQEFNSITFGNELKPAYNMDYHSPEATETNLPFGANRAAIEMLRWAKENGMPVRGHTLVWHSQCSDAVFCKNYKPSYRGDGLLDPKCMVDAETMKLRLESYIHHVMEYMYANGFGDVVYAWDVVNEAIEPGANPRNMRNSYWYRILGDDFLMEAFRYAREAVEKYSAQYADLYGIDPTDTEALKSIQPKLFYNDYNEFQANKRDAIIRAVTPIAEAGYIDGIGMQGHLSDTTDIGSIITALNMYSQVVSEVQITELDVSQSSSGPNAEYNQGKYYNRLFAALVEAKRNGANLTAVTIWGLTDDNSWKKESHPLIFNGDLSHKAAYEGIVAAVAGLPMPEPEFETPDFSDGIFTFEKLGKNANLTEMGITPRGGSSVSVQSKVTHLGKGAVQCTDRTAAWHGVSFDVTRFVGQTIQVEAWVKSEDPEVRLTADIDGVWPNISSVDTSEGKWVPISGTYTIPAELSGLKIYFETNGMADIFVDDVTVKLVGMDEGFEGENHIAKPRGVGHMPKFSVSKESHSGKYGLMVTRQAQEASVQFAIGKYAGRTVEVSTFVKTRDKVIRMGLEGTDQMVEIAAGNGWNEIRGTFNVAGDNTSAQIYVETDGVAMFFVDDFSLRIGAVEVDFEDGGHPFTPRWQGAGKLEVIEEEGNHVLRLSEQDQTYYGICFDVTPYLGMEVEISFDVKTDDNSVKLTGDIDNVWPTYLSGRTTPGAYTTISGTVRFPADLEALRVYIETAGKADLYIDNFRLARVQ